jgi:cytosine/adenosine deaminase-related metal-dependent hydrolase
MISNFNPLQTRVVCKSKLIIWRRKMNLIIRGSYFVLPLENSFKIKKQDIYIKDGKISFHKNFDKVDTIINAENKIIFPGLVNAHHHIYSCLSKGIPAKTPFNDFMGTLKRLWWKLDRALDKESTTLSTVLTVQDCIKSGVTTVFDHHISANYIESSLDTMQDVFDVYGLNSVLCFETSNRNGQQKFKESLQENIRFCRKHKNSPNTKGMIGMHALLTLSNDDLKIISELSEDFPIHCHIAEGVVDEIQSYEKYKKSVVQRLEDYGLLRKNSLLIHASNIGQDEVSAVLHLVSLILQSGVLVPTIFLSSYPIRKVRGLYVIKSR